jgi:hypothetical protein
LTNGRQNFIMQRLQLRIHFYRGRASFLPGKRI